ncbi:unnamed protein product [Dicrocoelium dendriticum]|nr:unnamed protein product [Dicrocoelium dendriticum]
MNLLCRKDGRRLVGRGERRDGSSRKNLILEAVSKAVVGLDSHCSDIEEKILEKIRIQEQCSKAVLTNAVLEQPETDVVLVPKKPPARGPRGIPVTGNIIERVIMSHRVWRIVPFNFESHPGIRMNVPQEKLSWKVPYQEYRTYKINEDRLAVPYEGMDDSLET